MATDIRNFVLSYNNLNAPTYVFRMSGLPIDTNYGQDLLEIHGRLFNHRPFVQGETRHFVKEFEEKRQDREVENVFSLLERIAELRDSGLPKLKVRRYCLMPIFHRFFPQEQANHEACTRLTANLLVAESMCNRYATLVCTWYLVL